MIKLPVFLLLICFCSTLWAQDNMRSACELPNNLDEISGMAFDHKRNILWAVNDSGNDAVVYGINPQECRVVSKLFVKKAYNKDWESLTLNDKGQLFVADIGNNNYDRKSLKIYWIDNTPSSGKTSVKSLSTKVKFPEAVSKKGKIKHDFEAMVYVDGYFYFFSKTEKKDGFSGYTQVFKAAAVPGTVHASKVGQISLCNSSNNCKITDAAYNYKTKTLALLGHKNIWIISDFLGQLENQTIASKRFKLGQSTQKEGITFASDQEVYVSEEKTKGSNLLYIFGW